MLDLHIALIIIGVCLVIAIIFGSRTKYRNPIKNNYEQHRDKFAEKRREPKKEPEETEYCENTTSSGISALGMIIPTILVMVIGIGAVIPVMTSTITEAGNMTGLSSSFTSPMIGLLGLLPLVVIMAVVVGLFSTFRD